MTPQQQNITDTVLVPAWKENEYSVKEGREIYEELSLTGINQSVVNSLIAFICGESSMKPMGAHEDESEEDSPAAAATHTEWPEIPVDEMCTRFIVDGTFAIRLISDAEMKKDERLDNQWEFLSDLMEVHQRLVVQKLRDPEGNITSVVRVWQQRKTDWLVRDIENYGNDSEIVKETNHYPLDAFFPYPSGKGLLYWNQFTYRRIEEIEQSIRKQTGKAALSLILTGYMGDIKQAQEAFAMGGEVIHIPGNPTVTRVASTGTVDQLMKEGEGLMRLFIRNTYQIEISETATMSGVSRRLAMTPMLHYVRMMQAKIETMYEKLGYELSLRGLNIMTPEERSAELDFLKRGRDEGIITDEEYKNAARALYN